MPRKIRQLQADLRKAGFIEDRSRGKGDHVKWFHLDHPDLSLVLDGQRNDDAKPYQEKDVRALVREVEQRGRQK